MLICLNNLCGFKCGLRNVNIIKSKYILSLVSVFTYLSFHLVCFSASFTVCQHSSPPEHRRGGTLDGSEQWGYATPRGGVHMFWWLYHTTHPDGILERPLLIWIQVVKRIAFSIIFLFQR